MGPFYPALGFPSDRELGFPSDRELGFPSDRELGFPSDRELGFPSDKELARYRKEVEYPAHVLNKEVAEKRVLSGIEMAFDKFRL